jgi:hypothetical protein
LANELAAHHVSLRRAQRVGEGGKVGDGEQSGGSKAEGVAA